MKYITKIASDFDNQVAPRDGFGKGLVMLGEINEDVVALTGDLAESTRVLEFSEKYPHRFVEVGVAEQNMAGIAAGMSFCGKIPFITSYAVFSPGRNWDQIRVSVCYSEANVKVVGAHAGISVGPDGATHQALEDIAITRVLPNMVVVVPTDNIEAEKATLALAKHKGPAYIRFGREKTPVITAPETPFQLGKALPITAGDDVTIFACGQMVYRALEAAKQLEKKDLSASVINIHTIKPLDVKAVIESAKHTGAVVTAEEHQKIGGLGSAIAEVLAENHPVPMERVGISDTFGESGEPNVLMDHYGLSIDDIVAAAERVIKRKNAS